MNPRTPPDEEPMTRGNRATVRMTVFTFRMRNFNFQQEIERG